MATIKESIENLNQLQSKNLENSLFFESISNQIQDFNNILRHNHLSQISQLQQTISDSLNNIYQVPEINLYISDYIKNLHEHFKFKFEVSDVINSLNSQLANSVNSHLSGTITNLTDNLCRLNKISLNNQIILPYDNISESIEIVSDYIDDLRDISSDSDYESSEIEPLTSFVSNIPKTNMASIDINTLIGIIGIIISIITFFQTTFDDSSSKQLEILDKINTNLELILENSIPD